MADSISDAASQDGSGGAAVEIERLRAADATAPLDAKGLNDLVGLLTQASRDEEASVYAARLLSLRPGHRRALRVLTRWPRTGVDVAAGWRSFAATAPEDPEPWLQIARISSRAKDANASIEACDAVLARAPGHAEALSIKVTDLPLAGRHEELAEVWTSLNAADPKRATTQITRAAEGMDTDAAAALLGAAAAAGALDGDLSRLRAGLRIKLAAGAYEAEAGSDDEAAARAFWRLSQLEPGEADYADGLRRALGRLSATFEKSGREPGRAAVAAARVVARLDPKNQIAHVVVARAMAAGERWREAAEALDRALELGGADRGLRLQHAAAAARSGQVAAAMTSWRLARADPESDTDAGVDRSTRNLLQRSARETHAGAVERGDLETAWVAHQALVELEDDPNVSQSRLAALLKDTEKAIRDASNERAPETADLCRLFLAAEPGDARVTLILGRALLRERRYEEALPVWRELSEANPGDVEPALQLARLARRLDDWDLGARESARVLALVPDHEEGASLKKHFDENAPRA